MIINRKNVLLQQNTFLCKHRIEFYFETQIAIFHMPDVNKGTTSLEIFSPLCSTEHHVYDLWMAFLGEKKQEVRSDDWGTWWGLRDTQQEVGAGQPSTRLTAATQKKKEKKRKLMMSHLWANHPPAVCVRINLSQRWKCCCEVVWRDGMGMKFSKLLSWDEHSLVFFYKLYFTFLYIHSFLNEKILENLGKRETFWVDGCWKKKVTD